MSPKKARMCTRPLSLKTLLLPLALNCGTVTAGYAEQSLESQANDPTASLMAFQLQNLYSYNHHNTDQDSNKLQFRAAIPFELGGVNNIARITLPYSTDTVSGETGLNDTTIFNLAAFDRSWGRVGVGLVGLLPTGESSVSAEKWGLGPALGFVAQKPWGLFGLFNQNIFTVAGDDERRDVNVSALQPIVDYPLGEGWSIGTSEMNIVYDWKSSDFVSLPVGAKLSKMIKLGGSPVQLQAYYEYNFYDDGKGPEDTLALIAKLLLPK